MIRLSRRAVSVVVVRRLAAVAAAPAIAAAGGIVCVNDNQFNESVIYRIDSKTGSYTVHT